MRTQRTMMWTALMAIAVPAAAESGVNEVSDPTTSNVAERAAADECMTRCSAACSDDSAAVPHQRARGTKATRRAPKVGTTGPTAMDAPRVTAGPPEAPATAPRVESYAPLAVIDPIVLANMRTEERARAAEEFNAKEQAMTESHAAAVDSARAAGRAEGAADVDAVRSTERARYDADLKEKDKVISDALVTPVGLYGFVGGGATQFTQPDTVGTTGTGGYWDARLGIGTRSIVGAEVAYMGSARNIQALGLASDAYLLGNGVEGVGRLNIPITTDRFLFEPYTFAGVGWQHYSVMSASQNTSSIDNDDDVMTVPLGVGLALGFSGVTLDVRGTYRQALGSDLLGTSSSSFDRSSLNSWGAGAALGFEF